MNTTSPVFTSRLAGRQILDSDGLALGRVRDVVILPTAGGEPPWVLGVVVTVQRRRIFVNLGRVAEISVNGVYLRGGTVDLRRFSRRTGEILASDLYGRAAGEGRVVLDVGITRSQNRRDGWEVCGLAVGPGRGLRHHSTTVVPWGQHPELFKAGELADLLEELPEEDQIRLLAGLGLERTADIVEEMEPDDAADLLAEMPAEQRERLLAAMEQVQAADLRRLLRYDATTAGGLMTSQPLTFTPDAPVAEVLGRIP